YRPPQPSTLFPYTTLFRSKFRWAKDYAAVRDVLYEDGGFDVNVVPGMTVPTDLPTMFSLRTKNLIHDIAAEHPDSTVVKLVGQRSEEHTSELQSRGHLVCR